MDIDYENEFPALRDIKALAKKNWGEEYDNDEDAFRDAFSNGIFHEEEPFWSDIAKSLTDKQLVNLAISAMRPLVVGEGGNHDDTVTVMEFYSALNKWTRNHLKSLAEIEEPLAKFRDILIRRTKSAEISSWWIEVLRGFSLVDLAIHGRMGMWGHPTSEVYSQALRQTIDKE